MAGLWHHRMSVAWPDKCDITGRARHGWMSTAQLAEPGTAGTWPHLVAFPEPSPRHCCRHCRAVTDLAWPGAGDPPRDLAPVRLRGLLQWAVPDVLHASRAGESMAT